MNLRKKILIIEDNSIQSKIIQNILSQSNYEVFIADNGALGIQMAIDIKPDLILCDINMEPLSGYQVYNILNDSSIIDRVPFIFITSNSGLNDIRLGMNIGADDYFIKPISKETLLKGIEKRLSKFNRLREFGERGFKAIFNLSPNGIFLFDENSIIDANPAFLKATGIAREELPSYAMSDIITKSGYENIAEQITYCSKGLIGSFNATVCLNAGSEELKDVDLYITSYEKYAGKSIMQGLIILTKNNKRPKEIDIYPTNSIKNSTLPNLIDKKNSILNNLNSHTELLESTGFFSKREIEVLALSLEGLPMKVIADRLSISIRTVEKHRSNLMEKSNAKNMIEVIVFALRNNLIDIF